MLPQVHYFSPNYEPKFLAGDAVETNTVLRVGISFNSTDNAMEFRVWPQISLYKSQPFDGYEATLTTTVTIFAKMNAKFLIGYMPLASGGGKFLFGWIIGNFTRIRGVCISDKIEHGGYFVAEVDPTTPANQKSVCFHTLGEYDDYTITCVKDPSNSFQLYGKKIYNPGLKILAKFEIQTQLDTMAQTTDDVVYEAVELSEWLELGKDDYTWNKAIPKKMTINYNSLQKVVLSASKNFLTVFCSKLRDHY